MLSDCRLRLDSGPKLMSKCISRPDQPTLWLVYRQHAALPISAEHAVHSGPARLDGVNGLSALTFGDVVGHVRALIRRQEGAHLRLEDVVGYGGTGTLVQVVGP